MSFSSTFWAKNRCRAFFWQRVTTVTLGRFAGSAWENHGRHYAQLPELLCNCMVYTPQLTSVAAGRIIQPGGPRAGHTELNVFVSRPFQRVLNDPLVVMLSTTLTDVQVRKWFYTKQKYVRIQSTRSYW
jgi:hypothetical protein